MTGRKPGDRAPTAAPGNANQDKDGSSPGDLPETGFAFEHLRAGLHRYLLRHLHRAEDVEDLAQEVYLRLLRFADRGKVRSPQAYIFRVAFNVLYEFKLHRARGPVAFDSSAAEEAAQSLADEMPLPEEVYERSEREVAFKDLIERLPPMQRVVLLLSSRENLSYAQIASKLGISASTARVHLFRAVAHLKSAACKEKAG